MTPPAEAGPLVLDTSVAIASLFADEATSAVVAVMERVAEHGALVPSLWRFEVANALLMAERRGRLTAEQRDLSLIDLAELPIDVDPDAESGAWTSTVVLAARHGLTIYDAAYLDLALRQALPLATLDAPLRRACQATGVAVLG